MEEKFLLFKLNRNHASFQSSNDFDDYSVSIFSPKPWNLGEGTIKDKIFRFYISILTLGETKIYYVSNKKGEIVHSSYLITKNWKYPFIGGGWSSYWSLQYNEAI